MVDLRRRLRLLLVGLLFFAVGVGIGRVWGHYQTALAPSGAPTPESPPASLSPGADSGPLRLVRVYPEPGEVGVLRSARLLLFFDRPVPLSALEANLTLDPPLQLRFEPYGDCGWAARPLTGWTEGRLFTVRVNAPLAGSAGSPIGRDLQWSFRTAALTLPDGEGAQWEDTLGLTQPVWSPDGTRLAAVRRDADGGAWRLVVYDVAMRKASVVGPARPAAPVWVGNGRLAVPAPADQGGGVELRQYDIARGTFRILVSAIDLRQAAWELTPHRGPGGAWTLEVSQGSADAHSDISQSLVWLGPTGGLRWLEDPPGTKWFLGWDRSGRVLLLNTFADFDHSHSFRYDILTWDPVSGEVAPLVGDGPIAGFGGAVQQGDEIAIWTWTAADTGSSILHRPARLLRYRAAANELLALAPKSPTAPGGQETTGAPMPMCWQDSWPSWAPDGARVAFASNRGGSWDIWTMRPDGSDPRRLTTDGGEDTHPAWSPDGKTIAFLSSRSGRREVWLMDADGANQRPAAEGSPRR